ncbi:hypothetical protein [Streptomyces sp. NPDC097981]|uniref:hypothetical protein n=1 Tax=Streptomyces sp. NPDC097981 TaxID=3155428 RepID=UPI0033341DBB
MPDTSSGTTMPWLSRTGAVLQVYCPGQEGAAATAGIPIGGVERHAWVLGSGRREVFAGRSSRELHLRAKAVVKSR